MVVIEVEPFQSECLESVLGQMIRGRAPHCTATDDNCIIVIHYLAPNKVLGVSCIQIRIIPGLAFAVRS